MKFEQSFYSIHRSWMLGLFLIVPLVLLVWSWDMLVNDRGLLPYLGPASLFLPLYLLIFEMPHIFASFIGFLDKEYVTYYRSHLMIGLPLMLLGFFVLLWTDFVTAVAAYLAATMYHVIRQQTGIALMFGVPKNKWHERWTWSLVLSTAVMYVAIMLPRFVEGLDASCLVFFISVTLLTAMVSGGFLARTTSSRWGISYIAFTMLMVITSYTMLWFGYFFLAIFVARFIHDVTAFLFYITHEMNRNKDQVRNFLYTAIPLLPLSLIVIVPLIAIFLGAILRETISNTELLFTFVMTFGFIHYYLESVMWKRGSPHREFVKVV